MAFFMGMLAAADAGRNGLARTIPWLVIIISSFIGVMLHTIISRRRRRQRASDAIRLLYEGRSEEAAAVFEAATKRDRSDVYSWFHLALCRELSGDADGARRIYEEIIDDPRVDFAARSRLDEIAQGRLLDVSRLRALSRFEEGVGYLAQGELEAALHAFDEGITLNPAYGPARYYLGVCAEMNGRPHEALDHYRFILEQEAEPTLVQCRIAAVEAGALWTLNDTHAAIALRKGWNYLASGDLPRAVEELETLARRQPEEYLVHFGLALCHILTGTPAQAREHYQRVPEGHYLHDIARRKLAELDADDEHAAGRDA